MFRSDLLTDGNFPFPKRHVRDQRPEENRSSDLMTPRVTLCMKMSRAEAEDLAEQICDALRPQIVRVVADLLAGPQDGDLSPRDLARVERAAANVRRRMEGLPQDRRRKVG